MIRFLDGPAKGQNLDCERLPLFVRAVKHKDTGKWDACDQLGDSPLKKEEPVCYIRAGAPSTVHIDGIKDGKRFGRWLEMASYRLYERQPDEQTMRDNERWTEWCHAEHARRTSADPSNPPTAAVKHPVAGSAQAPPEVRAKSGEPEV